MATNNVKLDFESIAAATINGSTIAKKLVKLPTAKRHAVRLNGISGTQNRYQNTNVMKSRQLVSSPAKSIAIFCNEYIPEHFPVGSYLEYILNVNGKDYPIVPINADRDGTKIIRTTEVNGPSAYTQYLSEEIKSAFLTIKIITPNDTESPFFSNLKILLGGE